MKQVNMQENLIENILNIILSELSGLHSLLTKEKQLLSENDFDNINSIAQQKKQIITNIEFNDTKFKEMLKILDSTGTNKSIHDIIAENIPGSLNLWIEIEESLKKCKDKNSINGIILSNNRRQIQQHIAILQGQSNEILIYGATGESVVTRSTLNSPLSV